MKVRAHILSPSVARGMAVLCAAVFVTSAHTAQAGINVWTSHGPHGGNVHALAIDPITPSTLYAGTGGGVFKSTDAGATWSAANTGLTNAVDALAIDPVTPSTLYAGRWDDPRRRLQEHGRGRDLERRPTRADQSPASSRPWPSIPSRPARSTRGRAAASSRARTRARPGGRLTRAGRQRRLCPGHRSHHAQHALRGDGSAASSRARTRARPGSAANAGLTNSDVYRRWPSIPSRPARSTRGRVGGVFKSTDAGATWSAATRADQHVRLRPGHRSHHAQHALRGTTAAASSRARTRARPGAATQGWPTRDVVALAIDPITPSTLYAGRGAIRGGVFKSTDAGATWGAANAGLTNSYVLALAIDPITPSTLYAGTGGAGVSRARTRALPGASARA